MRFVVGFVALALTAPLAFADDTAPPPEAPARTRARVPLRLVKVLTEGKEALLFDRIKGGHVLAEVGATIEGYVVESIDDDEITLSIEGTSIVLAAPPEPIAHARYYDERQAPATKKKSEPGPVDPYADAKPATKPAKSGPADPYASSDGPIDPYAEPPIHVVEAPVPAGEVRTTEAPGAKPAPAPVVATPAPVATPGPAGAPAVVAPALPDGTLVLNKHEVQVALADFGKLASSVRGAFVPAGVRLDGIAEGSLFAKAGLRAADVVTTVDGQALHSIDDAAELYVRAATAKAVTVQVLRAGKPTTLHVSIQ
jgi:hypothetical protein